MLHFKYSGSYSCMPPSEFACIFHTLRKPFVSHTVGDFGIVHILKMFGSAYIQQVNPADGCSEFIQCG